MSAPICFVNIPSRNLEESAEWYGRVFGWETAPNTETYTLFMDGGHGGGFTLQASPSADSGVLLFITAEDVDAKLAEILEAGGKVIKEKQKTGGGGDYAVFEDPHGNWMGIATMH